MLEHNKSSRSHGIGCPSYNKNKEYFLVIIPLTGYNKKWRKLHYNSVWDKYEKKYYFGIYIDKNHKNKFDKYTKKKNFPYNS